MLAIKKDIISLIHEVKLFTRINNPKYDVMIHTDIETVIYHYKFINDKIDEIYDKYYSILINNYPTLINKYKTIFSIIRIKMNNELVRINKVEKFNKSFRRISYDKYPDDKSVEYFNILMGKIDSLKKNRTK